MLCSCKLDSGFKQLISGRCDVSIADQAVLPLLTFKDGVELGSCTGTIIAEEGTLFILTASHCLDDNPDNVVIANRRLIGQCERDWIDRAKGDVSIETSAFTGQSGNFLDELSPDPLSDNDKFLGKIAESDFTLAAVPRSRFSAQDYDWISKNIALKIGYKIDATQGIVTFVGAGRNDFTSGVGIVTEASNLKVRKLDKLNTLKTTHSSAYGVIIRSGDSGGPLIHTNSNNEKFVVGVLSSSSRNTNENYFSNLAGSRYSSMRDLLDKIGCGTGY